METALYISSNLLHVYSVYIFFQTMLKKSCLSKWLEVSTFLGYYVLNSLGFLIYNNLIVNLATNIIPLLLITFQYREVFWGRKIFSVFSACALGMFVDLLVFSVLPSDSVLVENGVVQSVVLLIIVFILKKFVREKDAELKSNHIWFIVLVSVGTIAVGQLTIDKFNTKSLMVSIILLLVNFLNFYMYDKDLKNLSLQHTMKMISAINTEYKNQMDIMSRSQKKVKLLKHDMTNHMYDIRKLISNGKYKAALDYIDQIENFANITKEIVATGNDDIDCILNYKLSVAEDMGTEIFCDIYLPNKLAITTFDITTIFGNFLDNAINALQFTDDKRLTVKSAYKKGIIKISVENTYNPESPTDKNREGEHGLGLLSVKHAVEKYDGIIKTSQTDKMFYANAIIYNDNSQKS